MNDIKADYTSNRRKIDAIMIETNKKNINSKQMMLPICLFLILGFVSCSDWAVIVSGSSGYWNYRHQAAAASAYHYYIKRGIPKQNIILFISSGVARDELNPFKGKLFSYPGLESPNKMEGVEIEYSGEEVTASKVLNVLAGNSFSAKRVLRSTYLDTVFFTVFEYGAPGVITLPKDVIYGIDLQETIQVMKEKRMYKELVITIDGEEDGLLFSGMNLKEYNVKLVTPSNQYIENTSIFCSPEDMVGGKSIGSCLNTVFAYTLFDGGRYSKRKDASQSNPFSNDSVSGIMMAKNQREWSVYDSRFNYLLMRLTKDSKSIPLRRDMQNEDNTRNQIEQYFNAVTKNRSVHSKVHSISEWECYKRGVQRVEHLFFWNEYGYRFFGLIVNMCEQNKYSF